MLPRERRQVAWKRLDEARKRRRRGCHGGFGDGPARRARGAVWILHRLPSARRRQNPGRIVHRAVPPSARSRPVPCWGAFVSEHTELSLSSNREGFNGLDNSQDSAKDIPRPQIARRQNGRPRWRKPVWLQTCWHPRVGLQEDHRVLVRRRRGKRGGYERSINESVERLQYLLQCPVVHRFLIAVERTDAQPEHRQRHGEAFPFRSPGPRQHRADARQVRRLDSVPRIDDPCPGQVRQDRIGVVRCPIVPLRDYGRSESQRAEFGEPIVHPKVNGSDDGHRAKECGRSLAREHVPGEEPQTAHRPKEEVANFVAHRGSTSVRVREVEQLRATFDCAPVEGSAPAAIDGG